MSRFPYPVSFRFLRELLVFIGADGRIRTADLLITNQLLYRLSYIGVKAGSIGDAEVGLNAIP